MNLTASSFTSKEGANLAKHARFNFELSSLSFQRLVLKIATRQVKQMCSGWHGLELGDGVDNLERLVPLQVLEGALSLFSGHSLHTDSVALALEDF